MISLPVGTSRSTVCVEVGPENESIRPAVTLTCSRARASRQDDPGYLLRAFFPSGRSVEAVARYHNVDLPYPVDHETFPGLRRISGTKIVAQSPPGCIVPEGAGPQRKPCLFDFDVMQEYIIPRKAFFNRFVAVNEPEGKYTVLGLPVAIAHPKYQRNEFIFNFGLVVVRLPAQSPVPRPFPSCHVLSRPVS